MIAAGQADPLPEIGTARSAGRLFGHPRGLFFLAGTELWERFSFYGMEALLTLYMVEWLFLPDHARTVWGLAALRGAAEALSGPLGPQAFASEIFGLYAGLAYFTPPLGGLIADRLLGVRRTVLLGAMLMAAGHLLMAYDRYFLVALGLLVVGCGCLKGNITAQVGQLYAIDDPARPRAFAIFNMSIAAGGLLGPFVCGAIGEIYGWHYGFGIAGILMLVAMVVYIAGARAMPPDRRRDAARAAPLGAAERRNLLGILLVLLLGLFFSIPYYQLGNAYILFLHDHVDRHVYGVTIPATSLMGVDSIFVIVGTPLVMRRWRRAGGGDDLRKIAIACLLAAIAYAQLAFGAAGGASLPIVQALAYSALLGIGFIYQWPTTLALVSRLSPPAWHASLMGACFLSMFASLTAVGWIGTYYERMSPGRFWSIQAVIALAGAVIVSALRPLIAGLLRPASRKDVGA